MRLRCVIVCDLVSAPLCGGFECAETSEGATIRGHSNQVHLPHQLHTGIIG